MNTQLIDEVRKEKEAELLQAKKVKIRTMLDLIESQEKEIEVEEKEIVEKKERIRKLKERLENNDLKDSEFINVAESLGFFRCAIFGESNTLYRVDFKGTVNQLYKYVKNI